MTTHAMTNEGPTIALPTRRLLAAALIACAVAAAGWSLVAWLGGFATNEILVGPCGAAIVAAAMVAGVLTIGPWKRRPVGLWTTFWMAATIIRMLLTAACTLLLYSAASFGAVALVAAVVGAYLLALLAEVLVLARFLRQSLSV